MRQEVTVEQDLHTCPKKARLSSESSAIHRQPPNKSVALEWPSRLPFDAMKMKYQIL